MLRPLQKPPIPTSNFCSTSCICVYLHAGACHSASLSQAEGPCSICCPGSPTQPATAQGAVSGNGSCSFPAPHRHFSQPLYCGACGVTAHSPCSSGAYSEAAAVSRDRTPRANKEIAPSASQICPGVCSSQKCSQKRKVMSTALNGAFSQPAWFRSSWFSQALPIGVPGAGTASFAPFSAH